MSRMVVDASIWTARFVPQDRFYEPARAWLDKQRRVGDAFLAPALLLTEIAGAISRRTGLAGLGRQAVTRLEGLPNLQLVQMDQELVRLATDLAADLGLRGADAFYVAVAHRLGLTLVTLDDDQRQRAARLVHVETL